MTERRTVAGNIAKFCNEVVQVRVWRLATQNPDQAGRRSFIVRDVIPQIKWSPDLQVALPCMIMSSDHCHVDNIIDQNSHTPPSPSSPKHVLSYPPHQCALHQVHSSGVDKATHTHKDRHAPKPKRTNDTHVDLTIGRGHTGRLLDTETGTEPRSGPDRKISQDSCQISLWGFVGHVAASQTTAE
jgi:hypothetical protein